MARSREPEGGIVVVLDLDGTVADTAGDLIRSANTALVSEGFGEAPPQAIKAGVGYGSKAMLHSGLTALGREASREQIERMAAKLVSHYEENIAVETHLFPGFIEAAAVLQSWGAKLLLCTNKRETLVLKLLSALQIADLFDAIAGGDSFPYHKPDPRHITELVALARGSLSAALMIGDSEADVAAARGAGIPVAVTVFGYAAVPAKDLMADAVIGHFSELPGLVDALLGKAARP